jgi:arylformamidase
MKVYDLTPPISPRLGVFPGDVKFARQISLDFQKGHHLLLSAIQATLHLGAHADSSSHYHQSGTGIEKRPLAAYFGSAQVISIKPRRGERISVEDLSGTEIRAPRILFCTGSFPNPDQWNSDFMSLSPELIHHLHGLGCVLVGIDTPSVDPEDSKGLESHQALFQTGICVLEGLMLSKVPPGLYTLMAAPLPIEDADASPVRALLFDHPNLFPASDQPFEIISPI